MNSTSCLVLGAEGPVSRSTFAPNVECAANRLSRDSIPSFRTTPHLNGQAAISRMHRPRFWVVSRAPRIPDALTTGPFNLEEARRHGLTKDHLLGTSWRRLGGGYYAFRAIADDPSVVLAAIIRRLPRTAVFSGRTAAWLHGLDLPPCEPVEVTVPLGCSTSRLVGVAVRGSTVDEGETVP